MRYNFDEILKRRDTESSKWNAYAADVLPLWVADMDFRSPQPVIDALLRRVEHGIFGYPRYTSELREAITGRLLDKYGWKVKGEHLVFLPGVVTGINLACHMFDDPTTGVIVQTPIYPPMLTAPDNANLRRIDVDLVQNGDGSYAIDWEAFEAAAGETVGDRGAAGLLILCNPHNPTGRVFSEAELQRIAEICLRYGVVICADEIHAELIYAGYRHIPIATLDAEIAAQTVTLIAPTKTFNIAGLQFSVAIIPDHELRRRFQHAGEGLVSWVNIMGLAAGEAAYRYGDEWLTQLMEYLEGNRNYLTAAVKDHLPGIQMFPPEATYLAWLDCRGLGLNEDPYTFFLRAARVGFSDGKTFGSGGEGFVRLNFGCPRSRLEEAVQRMKGALAERRVDASLAETTE